MRAVLARVFGEGFRIFFLAAGLFGALAMLVWEIWLGIHAAGGMVAAPPFSQPPHHWHAHEMIFGYAGAALAGFLLTAVPNWTDAPGASRAAITAAAVLWGAGRVAIWVSAGLPPGLVALADLGFLPCLALLIARQLAAKPKPRNLVFLGFLALLWVSNLVTHLDWMGQGGPSAETGLRAALLTLTAMIGVLGGRVTPAFTRNAMTRAGGQSGFPASYPPLDGLAIALTALLPVLVLIDAPAPLFGAAALIAGAAQLARLAGWRGVWTLGQPILWSLHLAFAMLGIGLIALGLAAFGHGSEVAALHLLGIGAVGGMTLAVMSRAILGHTGRPLLAPAPVTVAFALMALAAVIRWAGSSLGIDWYWAAMLISGAAWEIAMVLFVLAFLMPMLEPRRDS